MGCSLRGRIRGAVAGETSGFSLVGVEIDRFVSLMAASRRVTGCGRTGGGTGSEGGLPPVSRHPSPVTCRHPFYPKCLRELILTLFVAVRKNTPSFRFREEASPMRLRALTALTAAATAVVAVIGLACSKGGSSAAGGNEILVGEYGSLTGGIATFGISTRDGSQQAFDEINAAGGVLGKKIKLLVEDDQSKPEEV